MKKLSQTDIILYAMIKNPSKEWWYAKDFQYGEYFVGYEATARMSELANIFILEVIKKEVKNEKIKSN